HPGKKLQMMGMEFGQWPEWDEDTSLAWDQSNFMPHRGLQLMMRDINHVYQNTPALYEVDFDGHGFEWLDCDDAEQSLLSYARRDKNGGTVIVALNLTPVPRHDYRLGVFEAGNYQEIMNTDAAAYGGSDMNNAGGVSSQQIGTMGKEHSISIHLPPLSCVIFAHKK
ncbi:MAG: alpha amylase C-terminal domain-containing protein, partial [Mariprofundaceae bacterium]|nr:alpha amylase C-terminal domain-containing protein [Mariprofundaceae bacterium]